MKKISASGGKLSSHCRNRFIVIMVSISLILKINVSSFLCLFRSPHKKRLLNQ